MTGATASRRRAAIAISFGIQAVMIAALFGVPLEATHHSQAVSSVPVPVPQTLPPATAAAVPGPVMYPMRLFLMVKVDGGNYPLELPWVGPQPDPARVPAGKAETVDIMVTNPGPGTATNV